MKKGIAQKRFEIECGGMILNGVVIATDRKAQYEYMTYAIAGSHPDLVIAVRTHIEACYKREWELLQSLAKNEPYDLNTGWPQY